jgi:hypothetical protein
MWDNWEQFLQRRSSKFEVVLADAVRFDVSLVHLLLSRALLFHVRIHRAFYILESAF